MSARRLLELLRVEREALLQRVTALLRADERVSGAWLAGSLGRGQADELSDIDLWLAVADEHCPAMVAARREYVGLVARPLLVEEAPEDAPAGGAHLLVLYGGQTGPQQVDWYWQAQSEARVPVDARLLFERLPLLREVPPPATRLARVEALEGQVAFFWAMSNIAAKCVARRQPCAALKLLEVVGEALAEVKAMAGGPPAVGGPSEEREPSLQLRRQLALLRAMAGEMEALTPRIVALGGTVPVQAILQIHRSFDLAEAMVGEPGREKAMP